MCLSGGFYEFRKKHSVFTKTKEDYTSTFQTNRSEEKFVEQNIEGKAIKYSEGFTLF